jgi:hypothetical protein
MNQLSIQFYVLEIFNFGIYFAKFFRNPAD